MSVWTLTCRSRKGVWSFLPDLGAEGGSKTIVNRKLLTLASFAANAGPVSPLFHRAACWEM